MIGQTISHYRISEKLGEGGMGVVYKAQDTKLNRFVALKFLPPHISASEVDKARFIQEAQAASALNHPNVCTIHDIQDHDGQMFIVMEFVDGQTLRERKTNISFKQGLEIGIQIAEGLAAAHEKGIVHRDIKPENIMIRKDGIAQIMDFGLAKLRGVSKLTKEGSTIGTAGYMSPEQIQGMGTDHRSDIFSFGVLFFELLTGQLPFRGVHETALAYEIVNVEALPMSSVRSDIDPALDAIVLECLEKDPNERTQSIKQVAIDLKRFNRESTRQKVTRAMPARQFERSSTQSQEIPVKQRRSYAQWIWPVCTGLLVIALVSALLNPLRKSLIITQVPMHLAINLPAAAAHLGGSDGIAISPDGKYLAYTGGVLNNPQIYIRRMDQMDVLPLKGTEGGDEPVFSPDGEWIAFVIGNKILKVTRFGGVPENICGAQGLTRGLWWAPDNFIYFGHINRGLQRVSANGGTPEPVTTLDSTQGEISHRFPQLLPDGKTLIFTVKPNNITSFDDAVIEGQEIGSSKRTILVRGGSFGRYVPSGHLVFVRGNNIYAAEFDLGTLALKGAPTAICEGGWFNGGSGQAEISFSNTGAFVYAPTGSLSFNSISLAWMDRQGRTSPLLDTLSSYGGATLSPDGQKVALGVQAANDDIWIYQITRGTLTRLTFGGGNNDAPLWSPDGKYIFFQAERGTSANLFRKAWDGSGNEERLTTNENSQIPNSISPDGKILAFTQAGDIWMLPLDGERKPYPFIQSPAAENTGIFSRDGKWLAYNSNESGKFEIYVVPFPKRDGKWQVSAGGGFGAWWSEDGKELLYANGNMIMSVVILSQSQFDFSVPRKLCDFPSSIGLFDVAANGGRFVVGVSRSQQFTIERLNVVVDWFSELTGVLSSGRQ
jgi:eukaryotic-like serine/threonine-protein kinase